MLVACKLDLFSAQKVMAIVDRQQVIATHLCPNDPNEQIYHDRLYHAKSNHIQITDEL